MELETELKSLNTKKNLIFYFLLVISSSTDNFIVYIVVLKCRNYDVTSHTTYVVCVNFIHEWWDLRFKVDSER